MIAWIVAGIVLQVAMVVAGHLAPPLRDLWGPGGMLISLAVGALAAARGTPSWRDALVAGALAGGVGAFAGIGLALLLGDVPVLLLLLGTASSVAAGLAGAAIVRAVRGRRRGAA